MQKIHHIVAAILPPAQDVEFDIVPNKRKKEVWTYSMGEASVMLFTITHL